MLTEGKMQTADFSTEIVLPFTSLKANRTQANHRVIQANQSDIQANQSDIQANQSADFHNK